MRKSIVDVLIVDDYELTRSGMVSLLATTPGIAVVGAVSCSEQAGRFCRDAPPDVILMDANISGMGALEATRNFSDRFTDVPLIILGVYDHQPYPGLVLEAGARGYALKNGSLAQLLDAIQSVAKGQRYVAPLVAQNMIFGAATDSTASLLERISPREMQILLMVAQGEANGQIAARLNLSPKTVSTYRYRLYDKLEVRNDVELTRLALRYNLLPEEA